ncbi:hypothetical protein APS67_004780 [Streptomyces sp. AVP053U2]|nr:hypothetical protein APS67_004780 [Streptomyces sp. AVP053U2]
MGCFSVLLPEAVPQVDRDGRADHPDRIEGPPLRAGLLEEPRCRAEEHGHRVRLQLSDEPLTEVLPHRARPAHDVDVPAPGDGLRRSGALWRPSVTKAKVVPHSFDQGRPGSMGEHGDRGAERRVVTPGLLVQVVRRPARDHPSGVVGPLPHELGVAVLLATGDALALPPARRTVHPAEERLGAVASWVVRGDTGA